MTDSLETTQHADGPAGPHEFMVSMRDGCRLATDVYGIEVAGSPRPVVFERTPYGKRDSRESDQSARGHIPLPHEIAEYFVGRGYVVVRQDCRGRGGSEGVFTKYLHEGPDGADSVAWIAAQPWCDGRVLMTGVSYSAHAQTAAAAEGASELAAMFMDSGGFSSAYEAGMRFGGAFELKQATWAYRHALESPEAARDHVVAESLTGIDIADWFSRTPWRPGDSPLKDVPAYEAYLLEQWEREDFGEYWSQRAIYSRDSYHRFPDVPSYHISSWYDPYILSAIENFATLGRMKNSPAFLLLGPWTHGRRGLSFAGDVDFGERAFFDRNVGASYLDFRADWFDEVVRAEPDETQRWTAWPRVRYFVMGGGSGRRNPDGRLDHGGHWRRADTWPPAETRSWELHLGAAGQLSEIPERVPGRIAYTYDPANPVPTIGGQVTSGEPVMSGGAYNQVEGPGVFGAQPPYLPLSTRPDVVVFRTAPLEKPVTIAGPVTARFHVSCSAPDTDLAIKLIDEHPPGDDYPRGYAMNLTEGILRLRYRNSFLEPQLMEPGEIYEVTVTAPDTANLFAAGHRIRLDVSSSNYPRFDINPNTGTRVSTERRRRPAEVTLYTGPEHDSRLLLSLLPEPGPSATARDGGGDV
ncbi:CocE/NonD family hydrolase [Sediminivirga luteola]|uniref:CocE/NonD family hydrolase n=1 Tax=Sediminivirga luteola TaxID=1774748 RepID=UPI001F569D15|nr:CocE/NonD family hydrolase [Sediminivirga luteola]MCI2265163.1 CocE/NonD family hydrolase [Sediminivirga luteola]